MRHALVRVARVLSLLAIVVFPQAAARAAEGAASLPADLQGKIVLGDGAAADPFMGDYQGALKTSHRALPIVAQVVPRGDGAYLVRFLAAFDERCPPAAEVAGRVEGGVLKFGEGAWTGEVDSGTLSGAGETYGRPGALELKKVVRLSPRLGARPPAGAIVLFDGHGLTHWEPAGKSPADAVDAKEIPWLQIDDYLRVWPPLDGHVFGTAMRTREPYRDFTMHVEFRLPLMAAKRGQSRANSGIIFEDAEWYELQILDSYGLPGYWDDCGAIYQKEHPKYNLSAPPGQWQTYDIEYHAAKFDADGTLIGKPRITVDWNGKRVHDNAELSYSNAAVQARRHAPAASHAGRIMLQHHGDPVDFRNLWLKAL